MYYILFLLILILCFFESVFEKNKIKNLFFILAGLLFFTIQAFNTWAPDLESYKIQFDYIREEFVRQVLEPGHIFLIEIVKDNGGSFNDFIFVYAVLIMLPFLYFIKKSSPFPIFTLSLFFIIPFFPDITQIRVFLAFAIFFFSLQFFKNKKVIFYGLYLVSICCHYSMLAMIIFFILRKFQFFKDTRKNNIIILVGALILIAVPKSIANTVVVLVNDKYSSYLEGTGTFLGTFGLFLPFFILNNFVLYHYRKNQEFIEETFNIKYKKNLPLFIELISYSNYIILLQYFIRDFSRITMNLSILSFIYISLLLFYGYNKKTTKVTLLGFRFAVYIYVFLIFYIVFLLLNNGEYLKNIERTFSSNSLYGE